ncbi:YgfZ/GcvT domain-containing protein [Simplicispira psychrophila]|uniref:CAF17-like 4Fe-4S cluster assembly/insertion protein YgfZ n=1 Tax=Simplicispira psychrophila TaxID=80882 RepID=UPI00048207B3|nr:folate-binding protein YgfZ [Simplicispira psychrophila]
MTSNLDGITPLLHLGVIRAEGDDAAKFLHGQLTQDFVLLGLQEARLAAFLSAKGRMQASFIGFKRSPTEILLICSRDLLAPTLKRLSMFVMRAKAKLSDASDEFALYGIAGNTLLSIADSAQPAWVKADFYAASLVHLPSACGQPRALWVAPATQAAPVGPALDPALWAWGEVHSGVATLSAPLVDAFVPQMLNYESVGGVSFKKGCYPGQEVVARSQFRGAIKRRTYLAHAPLALEVGTSVFAPDDLEQPCGTVLQAAAAPAGGWDALVALQISAAEAGALHVGAGDGPALTLGPLPYVLLEDL